MSHVYFLLVMDEEELNSSSKFTRFYNDGREYLVPILHIKSDNKDTIREELLESIDKMLKYI